MGRADSEQTVGTKCVPGSCQKNAWRTEMFYRFNRYDRINLIILNGVRIVINRCHRELPDLATLRRVDGTVIQINAIDAITVLIQPLCEISAAAAGIENSFDRKCFEVHH
jgi:hypothetical protein